MSAAASRAINAEPWEPLPAVLTVMLMIGPALAGSVWTKPGGNPQDFQQRRYFCLREAMTYPAVIAGISLLNYGLAMACMGAHGWMLVNRLD
jgi:hypothetical protein